MVHRILSCLIAATFLFSPAGLAGAEQSQQLPAPASRVTESSFGSPSLPVLSTAVAAEQDTGIAALLAAATQVAAGYGHTCVLTSGGGVKCWGYNNRGQLGNGSTTTYYTPVDVSGLTSGVIDVTAGLFYTCAITDGGGVKCWGENEGGQLGDGTTTRRYTPVNVSGLTSGVAYIAAGSGHTCAVMDSTHGGGAKCWGYNGYGQLGDGSTSTRLTPVDVSELTSGVANIAVGENHTCAVTDAVHGGGVKCWGRNFTGQLGDGTTSTRYTPVDVSGLTNGAVAVDAGLLHTCAVTSGGGVKCWGYGLTGVLGDGTGTNSLTPVDVSGLTSGVANIAAGGMGQTCAVMDAVHGGGAKCWGNNVGDGTGSIGLTPVDVRGLSSGVMAMSAGESHACALTNSGAVKCWGGNEYGQLGDGRLPVDVSGLTNGLSDITAWDSHTCAMTSSGGVECWGNNAYGQLGDGTTTNRYTPVDVSGLTSNVMVVSAGQSHTCAVTDGGGVKCWGNNDFGQLGDGTTTRRTTPADVSGLISGASAVAAGSNHTCAVTNGGGIKCWGWNNYGQLGNGTTAYSLTPVDVSGLTSDVVAVTAGEYHSCALTSNGGVKCWGYNKLGELGNGTTVDSLIPVDVSGLTSGVVAVAAGSHQTCVLTGNGGVQCWGNNSSGQLGDGTVVNRYTPVNVIELTSGVAVVDAGQAHTCAVMDPVHGGRIKCWGNNSYGQLGDGTTTNRSSPVDVNGLSGDMADVAAGYYHTCAITSGGGGKCWGYNNKGQLGTEAYWTPVAVIGFEGDSTYTISGHVTYADGTPLGDVSISDGIGHSTATDPDGAYTLTGILPGTYTLTASKNGHTFSPASRAVTVPPDATGQDFIGRAEGTSLVYTGARPLTGVEDEVDGEADLRISAGDHVHLRLPFTNNGGTTIADATIEVLGAQHSSGTPGVSVYDDSIWHNNPNRAELSLGTIVPGETTYLDFWIYVTDSDPDMRESSFGQTWIEVSTLTGNWRININLLSIDFSDPDGLYVDMTADSCLHTPSDPIIERYAQYAAGACVKDNPASVSEVCKPRTPPDYCDPDALRCNSNDPECDPNAVAPCDPDTPEQAVRNLVDRVHWEFHQRENRSFMRHRDTWLLTNRGGDIGDCKHYTDLTVGLLRSLKLPARTVIADLGFNTEYEGPRPGHFWSEVFIEGSGDPSWRQADSGWNRAINQQSAYEDDWRISEVKYASADMYPLASATPWTNKEYRCIASCYQPPANCVECPLQSNAFEWPDSYSLSCVEDVTRFYHRGGDAFAATASTVGGLLLGLESPISVIRGNSFTASTGITNDGLAALDAITATVGLREYVDSTQDLFEVDPPYQVLNNVGAGETITVTWIITPLLTGSGVPLRFSAESDELFEVTGQPLVVNEPGTLPDLSLIGACGLGNVTPGQTITLTAAILDDNLQRFWDPATVVTATVVATPTMQFSTTLTLSYCESCQAYQGSFMLPDTAPIGRYVVDFEAAHPSYDPGHATSGFFVIPPLTLSLSVDRGVVGVLDTITLAAQVLDRDATVNGAAVSAEIMTPGGIVTAPLYFDADSETYQLTLRPADLAGNLGGEVLAGAWQIHATADYQGGIGSDDAVFTVVGTYPLSEVVISKLETGAELTWPHMGSEVHHYEIYRGTSPYFHPGGADSVKLTNVSPASAAGDELSFTDANAFTEPGTSYFYVVQPVDASGQFYLRSNRVGAFNFTLTPGTAQ